MKYRGFLVTLYIVAVIALVVFLTHVFQVPEGSSMIWLVFVVGGLGVWFGPMLDKWIDQIGSKS